MYQMLSGTLPFSVPELKSQDTRKALENLIQTKEVDYPELISEEAKGLINKML